VTKRSRHLRLRSFDDPRLRTLKVGIQLTGEDYENPPAAHALAVRGIVGNVRGFPVYGDYSQPDPQRAIVDAVATGAVDVAIVWGPLAGYYARHEPVALDIEPLDADQAGPSLAFEFDIAMGVRRDDVALRDALDAAIDRDRQAIRSILASYGVPLR
jgi:ABC-type amino acid transport substrate-binding protein